MRAHSFDVLGPGVDEGDVLTRVRHMRARIPADRARTHDRYLRAHSSPPILPSDPTAWLPGPPDQAATARISRVRVTLPPQRTSNSAINALIAGEVVIVSADWTLSNA